MKGFIFDLDGVIVDTAKYHYFAWRDLAKELGFEFKKCHNERQKGVSRMESLEIVLEVGGMKNISDEHKIELAGKKNDMYLNYINNINSEDILPGIMQTLEKINKAGYKIALGSASKNAGFILEKIKLLKYFDAVVDGNLVQKAKPDSEVFLTAAKLLHLQPLQCTVIEDAKAGVLAAKNAKMKCIGIGSTLHLQSADIVIDTTAKLPEVIFEL